MRKLPAEESVSKLKGFWICDVGLLKAISLKIFIDMMGLIFTPVGVWGGGTCRVVCGVSGVSAECACADVLGSYCSSM